MDIVKYDHMFCAMVKTAQVVNLNVHANLVSRINACYQHQREFVQGHKLHPLDLQSPCYWVWRRLLSHWGRVTHICVSKLTIIGSNNGLSPRRRQAIIWNNARILLIGHLGKKLSEILIEIQTFSLTKIHFKMSSAKWRSFCLGLNVLTI